MGKRVQPSPPNLNSTHICHVGTHWTAEWVEQCEPLPAPSQQVLNTINVREIRRGNQEWEIKNGQSQSQVIC